MMYESNKFQRIRYFAWLPALFVAAAIFYFSAQPADISTEMSDGVTRFLLEIAETLGFMKLSPHLVTQLCEQLSMPVRKSAHITEYMILYGTVLFGLYSGKRQMRGHHLLAWAFFMTVLYSVSDEIHQLFVPGRAGRITDVIIDNLGVTIVTFGLYLWGNNGGKQNKRYRSAKMQMVQHK